MIFSRGVDPLFLFNKGREKPQGRMSKSDVGGHEDEQYSTFD